jgi:LacI family transcriptional regulator
MATLKQIAEEARVSLFTVSRVLSGQAEEARISPSRAIEIERIAKRLNFRPNAAARAMRSRRSRQVGVLIRNNPGDRYTHPLAFETIVGINEGLEAEDHVLSIVRIGDVEAQTHSRVFRERLLDGMIIIDAMPDSVRARVEALVPRIVWCDANVWGEHACIRRDEVHAGQLAARAALDLGYRRLVFVALPEQSSLLRNYSLPERWKGICEVAGPAGVQLERIDLPDGHAMDVSDAIVRAMRPDICLIAYGVYQARWIASLAASAGVNPGHNFGLISCDDSHDMQRMWPGLSRVTFDRFAMGLRSARMMLRLLDQGVEQVPSEKIQGQWHPGNSAWGPQQVETLL